MFTIDRNKSLVNFTGSNVLRLQKPNHASDLTVGGVWYQRVHCLNLSHSQRGKVCCTNCTRQLSTLYWTHDMAQLKWNNCTGCMRKRSLLSRFPTYYGLQLLFFNCLTLNMNGLWSEYDSSKRDGLHTQWRSGTSQKNAVFSNAAVRTLCHKYDEN